VEVMIQKNRASEGKGFAALWQGSAIVLLAAGLGLLVNQWRPDALPLIADWSLKAQLVAVGQDESLLVSLEEAKALFATRAAVFIDARAQEFHAMEHLAGALNLPWEDFEAHFQQVMADVPPDALIITYCDGESCALSKDLALALQGKGYPHVRVLPNGLSLWKDAGLPLESR
jgi:rhodanese-related sulfurtransferase